MTATEAFKDPEIEQLEGTVDPFDVFRFHPGVRGGLQQCTGHDMNASIQSKVWLSTRKGREARVIDNDMAARDRNGNFDEYIVDTSLSPRL